jgi:hypothetical protein
MYCNILPPAGCFLAYSLTLEVEAVCSSEMPTRLHSVTSKNIVLFDIRISDPPSTIVLIQFTLISYAVKWGDSWLIRYLVRIYRMSQKELYNFER